MRKINPTSPDKVRGRLVKYRQGDCLAISYPDGYFLAALVSEKFNAYYDLTLIEYYRTETPAIENFIHGKFFGTRFGSWEDLSYAVDKRMIKCSYIDKAPNINKVGSVVLIPSLLKAAYSYLDDEVQLREFYLEELPVRVNKTKNAEKFPDLAFVSKHLVDMQHIIDQQQQSTTIKASSAANQPPSLPDGQG